MVARKSMVASVTSLWIQGLLALKVHAADISDRNGAPLLLEGMFKHLARLGKLWTDSGYSGRFQSWSTKRLPNWENEIVKHWWTGIKGVSFGPGQELPAIPSGFYILPRRCVAEQTLAWLDQNRRLSKDYERLLATSEAFVYLAMSRLMLCCLARQQAPNIR
jgi:putative transposase